MLFAKLIRKVVNSPLLPLLYFIWRLHDQLVRLRDLYLLKVKTLHADA